METAGSRFATEIATFDAHRGPWIAEGKDGLWVAIQGATVVGPFPKFGQAWEAGLDACWTPGSFLVRKIEAEDRPIAISHIRPRAKTPGA